MGDVSHKLINSAETCVNESLESFCLTHKNVQLLRSNHKVVLRADTNELRKRKQVTILSGGGAGHEPAFAGYVGEGMLTAAVSGSVFSSPPPSSVLKAIEAIASDGGTLVMHMNYTGDRLTFGIAIERARAAGLFVDSIVIGEDCALTSTDKSAGRRGLCGGLLAMKIAGALAEDGKSLEEIKQIVSGALGNMGTIGLSLSPCSIPGHGPTFDLPTGEMELGLGIHGEAGIKRSKVLPASECVALMLDHMTNPKSTTHLALKEGDKVALAVSNLGGTSQLEMNVVVREAMNYLSRKFVNVHLVCSGSMITSLEMHGVLITILQLDDILDLCLKAKTSVPAWPEMIIPRPHDVLYTEEETIEEKPAVTAAGATLEPCSTSILERALRFACEAISQCSKQLDELDRHGGDGDTGTTLKRGADVILKALDSGNLSLSEPSKLFFQLSLIAEENMGGSSGGLYALMLNSASHALHHSVSVETWVLAVKAAMENICRYGRAEIGDRTMLDTLHAAYMVLQHLIIDESANPVETFGAAVEAAEAMTTKTATMPAKAGRASYVNAALITQPDPGAYAVTVWLRAAYEAVKLQ